MTANRKLKRRPSITDFFYQCTEEFADFYFVFKAEFDAVRAREIKLPIPPEGFFVDPPNGEAPFLRIPIKNGASSAIKLAQLISNRMSARRTNAVRYRREMDQTEFHTDEDLRVIWGIQKGRCYYSGVPLGKSFEDRQFSVDHKEPLSWDGSDGPLNLVLTTKKLNAKKHSLSAPEFFRKIKATVAIRMTAREIDRLRRAHFKHLDRRKSARGSLRKKQRAQLREKRMAQKADSARKEKARRLTQLRENEVFESFPTFMLRLLREDSDLSPESLIKVVRDEIACFKNSLPSKIRTSTQLIEARAYVRRFAPLFRVSDE